MNQTYDYRKHAVLFVDDEPQALKLFEKTLSDDFNIRTAPSVAEAWPIIEAEGENLGIVITDQRMPKETGVDLLKRIKSHRPDVIRILTTAYSDLDSAIEAVNAGGAYMYITKPWKLPDLRAALKRAMEYFLVCRDRDRLLGEKLHVIQRMLIMDRVRGLAVLAAAVGQHFQNSIGALKSYVSQAPAARTDTPDSLDVSQLDLWSLARSEGEGLVKAVQGVLRQTSGGTLRLEEVDVGRTVSRCIEEIRPQKAEDGVAFQLDISSPLPVIHGDTRMVERLIGLLVDRIADMDGEDRTISIRLSPAPTTDEPPGVKLQIRGDGPEWQDEQLSSLYSAVLAQHRWPMGIDMDVLAAFFIAHHHGGHVTIRRSPPAGPGFEVILRSGSDEGLDETIDGSWFDDVFCSLED
jgi:two-component system probable response regulator PhcQ